MIRPILSKGILLVFGLMLFAGHLLAQEVSGTIKDSKSGEPLFAANVVITGTTVGATTDFDGNFKFNAGQEPPFSLTISYIGYLKKEMEVTSLSSPIKIDLETDAIMLKSVEIVESRISEKQQESALTVESMDIIAIKATPAANFYEGLGNLKGVDLTTASIGFTVINTRGFNSTSPVRSLQTIDGVDNQSPGLNFSLGNFLGASELDILKVDIIQGASSAFYGPNAFNGVIAMTTKSPFVKPGTSFQYKIGERGLHEVALRHAHVVKNKKGEDKFAYKMNLFYLQARDWEATNYSPIDASEVPENNPGGYDAVNIYGDEDLAGGNKFNQVSHLRSYPGLGTYYRNGYKEKDLVDYNSKNLKASLSLHYKIREDVEVIAASNFGTGTTVYQGENRFSLKNILFFQNRLEIKKKDKWFFRMYATNEDAGDSYDVVLTAFKMLNNRRSLESYYSDYSNYWLSNITPRIKPPGQALEGYPGFQPGQPLDSVLIWQVLANNYDSLLAWHTETANVVDTTTSLNGQAYAQPGTQEFRDLLKAYTSKIYTDNTINQGGTKFYDKSALYHAHGEYSFEPAISGLNIGKFTVGANARLYMPDSRGTIFNELMFDTTEVFVLDTNFIGGIDTIFSLDVDTSYRQIKNFEFGVYAGWERKFFKDKLKATIAARLDKNQNFPFLISPAASLVYSPVKEHTIRLSFSSAIRNPTLSDQYLNYDVGRAVLLGNLEGYEDLVTVESFIDFLGSNLNASVLDSFNVKPIVPEKVKTGEIGYRGFLGGHIYLDASYYMSYYTDFIGYKLGIDTDIDGFTGFPTNTQAVRIAANSENHVVTKGFSIGMNYFFQNMFTVSANYSWNKLVRLPDTATPGDVFSALMPWGQQSEEAIDDPLIPAFNTPEHKFNLGISGREIKLRKLGSMGFAINYKWIQGFLFEGSPQFTGAIPSYDMVGAQVTYSMPKTPLTFKLGVSNLFGIIPFFEDGDASTRFENAFNNENVQVYGGPAIGRMSYFSVLFELN
ncbi:MAG: iron complex outermembrane receptor protein [Bacteroidia bacterium]|jgi:iron complex outermembrane receptor protein